VLIGLANHASPDGKDTFPSEHTLVRYTCLSKRTVQTAPGPAGSRGDRQAL
jgi:hypothetical protein